MAGYIENKDAVLARLRRIEGQVRGLQRMVEQRYVLHRRAHPGLGGHRALQSVALELLDDHLAHCVADAIAEGGGGGRREGARRPRQAIARLVRS